MFFISRQADKCCRKSPGSISYERQGHEALCLAKSVAPMRWTSVQRAFAVEAYFSNGRTIIAAQRVSRPQFSVRPSGWVLGLKSVVTWVHPIWLRVIYGFFLSPIFTTTVQRPYII
jgi:hypothetical protein